MEAGKLDRRITLQRLTTVRTKSGDETETWAEVATVWAQKIEARGDERFSAATLVGKINRSFRILYSPEVSDVDTTWRVMFDDDVHQIIAYREIGYREGIELDCVVRSEEPAVQA